MLNDYQKMHGSRRHIETATREIHEAMLIKERRSFVQGIWPMTSRGYITVNVDAIIEHQDLDYVADPIRRATAWR